MDQAKNYFQVLKQHELKSEQTINEIRTLASDIVCEV